MKKESEYLSSNDDSQQTSSKELLIISIISGGSYLLVAFIIYRYLLNESVINAFGHGFSTLSQIIIGVGTGIGAAAVIAYIINRPPVSDILHDFYIVDMISKLKLSNFDCIQLSIFAGVGEELLFRGAIQPLLGIWITSFIFIGIHGYFKFKSAGHMLFGLTMFGLSMLLGYLFEYSGLITAMTAHAVYDVIMLRIVNNRS